MDSHINTADPWAATTEPPEPEVQEVHEPEPGADDDIVDAESPPTEDGCKGGLFGRRKIRERSSPEGEKGFDLIAPAPHLLGEDLHFEVLESGILTEVPELGLGDKMGAAEEVPFDPSLSMVKPLDEKALRADDIFDFETMSEEIASAVADAQPSGIFGALANPGAHFSPPEADVVEETVEDIAEEAEDIVEESKEPTVEEFFEDSHASVDGVVHPSDEPLDQNPDESEASGELDHADEAGGSFDEPEEEAAVTTGSDSEETPSSEEQEPSATTVKHEDDLLGFEDLSEVDETVDEIDIPADPFEDTPTEMAEDSHEVDEILELPDIQEASMNLLTTTGESGFSLTNAPAEPIDGEEDLFVSTGTEDTIQDIVLVTTDTVPGMEMGDSCGLVTAVQAADEASSLPSAIEMAHADLGAKAEEAGATAVISVTTSINEVQAGFLVIASGTAVVAAS